MSESAADEEFLTIWKDAAPELRGQLRLAGEGIMRLQSSRVPPVLRT